MSTATLNGSNMNALMGTYGSSSLTPSISLLGFVASEMNKLFRKPAKAPTTRAEQAEALRQYAAEFADNDPRFADDLYAAAARHEGLN